MTDQLMQQVEEAAYDMQDNDVLMLIVDRAKKKFFARSADEVVLYELRDYVINQLSWKKQSQYHYCLPLLLKCCEVMGEEFGSLFDDSTKTWRDASHTIMYN